MALVLPTASQAYSGKDSTGYQCRFTQQCIGTDRPCEDVDLSGLALEEDSDGWHLWGPDETWFGLTPLLGGNRDLDSWVSTDIDPSAQATALLSITHDGLAFLSIHGIFLTPEVIVQTGTCTRKDTQ
jgi:hypothetical protein